MSKTIFNTFSTSRLAGLISILLILLVLLSTPVVGQPVLGARNTALGGGGTAYLGGLEATFWNPANLAIKNQSGQFHMGVGHTGILYEPVLSTSAAGDQFFNFTDSFLPYENGIADINFDQREAILENNYPREKLLSQHQTRADIILGGVLWQRNDRAYSIVARTRIGSRIEVGRGWYSREFVSSQNSERRDFTLNQHKSHFYELAFGYAREFTFINGLLSSLSKLYVGISPKVVLAGPSYDATYNARYIRDNEDQVPVFASNFSLQATGEYSRMTDEYIAFQNSQDAISNHLTRKFKLQNTGYGLGFDFGLTYLIPLGSEVPTIKTTGEQSVVSKSLRFGFSVNDIGIVRHYNNPLAISKAQDTVQINQQQPLGTMFIGADGQLMNYLHNASTLPNPILNAEEENRDHFSALLPTSLNTGVLIELSRLKLMGDLTLGLNNTAFTNTKLAIHLGLEARPVHFLPLRIGTRFASGLPTHVGLGSGIETRHLDFTIGTQVILRSRTLTSEFVGGAFAGIQLHF